MLLTADWHLRDETAEIVLGKVLPGLRAEALRMRDQHIVILGDVFHIRYQVGVRLLNGLRDEIRRWVAAGIEIDVLPGNHDQYDVAGRHVLEYLDDIAPMVRVHTEPGWDERGCWVPYRRSGMVEWLRQARGARSGPVFLHGPIRGAVLSGTEVDVDGIDPSVLDGFQACFAGHYHQHQQVSGGAWYVGSPYQVSAAEAGQLKGFCQYRDNQVVFHERDWGPRYHIIHVAPGEELDLSRVRPGDDVRVRTAAGVSIDAVSSQLRAAGVQHVVTPAVEPSEARLAVGPSATIAEYAEAYARMRGPEQGLDPVSLIQVYRELTT